MFYLWIKLIHIVSSTILFGTGIGTAAVMLFGYYSKDIYIMATINRYVVMADWLFTLPSIIIQPLTGLYMVWLAHYSFHAFWIIGSLIGYVVALCCWLPVVFLQIRLRNLTQDAYLKKEKLPLNFYRLFRYWFILGWPAFFSFLIIFYLMTFKP